MAASHHDAASTFVPLLMLVLTVAAASRALAASRDPIMTSCPV
jgi:hypothetical protein